MVKEKRSHEAVWTIAPALVADVCDAEERATGNRDGGMFAAFYGWTIKAAGTLAFALSGYLLNLTGFDAALKTAQPELVLNRMRLIDFSLTALSAGLAVYFILQLKLPKVDRSAVPTPSAAESI
jgi:GPH family glycoside/pentoside/hexuronide:cation symporter